MAVQDPPTKCTDLQIADVAFDAGFHGPGLVTAVAVALAESGGVTRIVNVAGNVPHLSRDRGLWQINDYWHGEVTDALAFNPATAARAAFRISGGGASWTQWTTFTAGHHLQFVKRATMAAHVAQSTFIVYRLLKVTEPLQWGFDVAAVQHRLGIPVDGVYGHITCAAVQSFQHTKKITEDGIVGPRTSSLLGFGFGG